MATATSPQASSASAHIPTLDGWRGIAILLVLMNHAALHTRFSEKIWAGLGSFGVDVFFVLSGYIITARLIEERRHSSTISLRGFYARRAFRIFPIVMAYLLALCLAALVTGSTFFYPEEFAGSLFFFRNYQLAAIPRGIYTTHFWSLSIEEHFYLIWPALLLWFGNRRALWFASTGAIVCGAWRFYDYTRPTSLIGRMLPGVDAASRIIRTDARIDGLLMGSALALFLALPSIRNFIFRNFPKETPLMAAALLFINLQRTNGYPTLTSYALVTLMLASTLTVEEGLAHQWLNSRPLVWIGTISYSLYIWQQPFLLHVDRDPLGVIARFPLNFIVLIGVASLSFYFIERPAIAFGKMRKRTIEASVPASLFRQKSPSHTAPL